MKLQRIGIGVVLVFAAMAGQLFSGASAQAADTCTLSPILVNSCRPLLGGYTVGYPNVANGALGQVQAAESRIGRQYDIVHTSYHTGPSQLTSEEITLANRANTNIFLNWKPDTGTNAWLNADGVANGGLASTDAGIVEMADSVKSVPSKVMITIWHEPENDVTPGTVTSTTPNPGTNTPACPSGVTLKGTAGSPAQYVAMWQNVENIFAQQGVTNVVWVMTNETYAPFTCLTNLLYPGNNLVNWMAFDTYNSTDLTGAEGTPQAPFEATAGVWYNHLIQQNSPTDNYLSKPWMVGEFGSCLASHPQAQIDDYFADAKYAVDNNLYPNVKAYVGFDAPGSGVTAPGGCMVGYTPNGALDPTTQADYNSFADDPVFTDANYNQADTTPPSVPTGLAATPVSGSQINLSWTASTDNVAVTGYQVFRNGMQVATVTNGTTYSDTGLTDATSYQYTVDALDAAGNISAQTSAVMAITPDVTPPSVPTGLTATAAGGNQVNLSWNASSDNVGVAGYQVLRNGSVVAALTNGTTYSDTGLTDATSYQYTVDAYDAAGNMSAQSVAANASTPDITPPSVPTGLTATTVSGTQVDLSWNASSDNVGVTGYQVFRNGAMVATVTSGTMYSDTGLTSGTSYQYNVAAYDAAGNVSVQSAAVSAGTPDTIAPSAPTGLTATPVSGSQINLSWTAATDNVGVTGYQVFRNGSLVATVTSGTTYSDTGLTDATSYQYAVDAFDAAGNISVQSSSVTAMTPDATPPSVPSGLTATAAGGTQVNLSWGASTDNVGVAGYQVFRNGSLVASVTNGTTYSDTGLTNATSYQYTVDAYDAAGNISAQSAAASVNTLDTVAPSVPNGLAATAAGGTQVNLSWNAATDNVGVTGYQVFRNGVMVATVTNGTTYSDMGLTDATSYQYTVTAFDAAGNVSAQSATVTGITPDTAPPTVPMSLTATILSGTQIQLHWNASTDNVGVTGYVVYRNGSVVATVTSGTTYTDTGLTNATLYNYSVAAYDAAANMSAQSSVLSVSTPDTAAPTVPGGLTATAASGTQVNLSWTAAADNVGVVGYKVYRNGTQIATVTSGTSYVNTGLTNGVTYQYNVAAYDAAGNTSAQSATATVRTLDTAAPSVPTNLAATSTTSNQVNLSWTASTDNVGVTGYQVFRNGTLLATVSSGTSYQDNSVVAKVAYSYTVLAFDAAGNKSAQTKSVSVTPPDTTPPSVPANFKAVVAGKAVTLTWTASTDNIGVTGYQIYRNGAKLATTTKLTYSDTTVVQGTTYKYTVAAFDAAGNASAQTPVQTLLFPDTTPPSQPTGLTLTPGTKSISLKWTASTDNVGVTGYQIYRGSTLIATVTGTTYNATGLVTGSSYSFHVVALDAAGNLSTASSTVTAKAK